MRVLFIAAIITASAAAHAQPTSLGAWMHYEASEQHAIDNSIASPTDIILVGARAGGFIGTGYVAYAGSLDVALGSTIGKSGFMYQVSLLPIGFALRPSERSFIAVATGITGNDAIGTIDGAVALPVEVTAESTVGPLRFLARARASFLESSDGRRSGSPTFGWADEVDGTFAIRFGHRTTEDGYASGNGYFVGVTYREMEGAKFLGVVIGRSVETATQYRSRNVWELCEDCN